MLELTLISSIAALSINLSSATISTIAWSPIFMSEYSDSGTAMVTDRSSSLMMEAIFAIGWIVSPSVTKISFIVPENGALILQSSRDFSEIS